MCGQHAHLNTFVLTAEFQASFQVHLLTADYADPSGEEWSTIRVSGEGFTRKVEHARILKEEVAGFRLEERETAGIDLAVIERRV